VTAAGFTQVPAPSQVEAPVKVPVPVGQLAARHDVPLGYFWHTPAWQRPLVPQLLAPWSLHIPVGSALPVATLVQVPVVPDSAHDWQAPVQALSQQTPWAQKLLLHWSADEQVVPLLALPHEFGPTWPHTLGDRHWLLVVQALKHLLPLQV
jgi:hypothetical protein